MSYKAYKDSDDNYDIRSSKDDAMYGVGSLIGWIIAYTILLPFILYDKLTYDNGILLGTDKNNFIIFIEEHQKKYLIKSLESIHYGFNTLKLKFKNEKKIAIFKNISAEKAIEQLEPLYDILDEKKVIVTLYGETKQFAITPGTDEEKVIVTLYATDKVNKWSEKYLKGETKKKVKKTSIKAVNEPYKKIYKIINGKDMQELEINTQKFLDNLGVSIKKVQLGAISKVDESYCQNISYMQENSND